MAHGRVVVIADPHPAHPVGGEAHEPGVVKIARGAGLARRRPAEAGAHAGAVGDHPLHHPHHVGGSRGVIDLDPRRGRVLVEHLAPGGGNLLDQEGLRTLAALLEHLVAACQFQQVHLVGAERQRQVRLVGNALQPEAVRQFGDLVGADLVGQPRGDGVDRVGQGLGQGHRASIAGLIVGRGPGPEAHRGVLAHVGGLEARFQRGGVDERLERGARLALGLGRPVEG